MDHLDVLVRSTPLLDHPTLMAVDGVDGSGKTTFSATLADRYAQLGRVAHVVHMDDFLSPRAMRYRLGRDSAEGFFQDTYDLATFAAKVIEPLRRPGGPSMVCRAFDYRADRPIVEDPIRVSTDAVVIVEGMFLHRDELLGAWDMSVLLDVPFAISVRRLAERDGTSPNPDDPSVRRYVEGQRIYLSACRPHQRATHVITNYGNARHFRDPLTGTRVTGQPPSPRDVREHAAGRSAPGRRPHDDGRASWVLGSRGWSVEQVEVLAAGFHGVDQFVAAVEVEHDDLEDAAGRVESEA